MEKVISALFLLLPMLAMAQDPQNVTLVREGKQFHVGMNLTLDKETVQNTHAYILTPVLVGEQDSLALKPVGYFSKDKFYHFLTDAGVVLDQSYTKADLPQSIAYSDTVPYEKWMNQGVNLKLVRHYEGCCKDSGTYVDSLSFFSREEWVFQPKFIYVSESGVIVKTRNISNEVSVTFPVNVTKLNPDYQQNAKGLTLIENDINLVKQDPDLTIQKIEIQSTSSPEGRYSANQKLSEGRVQAIAEYIAKETGLPESIFSTSAVPEDWEGLRAFVEGSELKDKETLLKIIDSSDDPDVKERKLKARGASWKVLLQECFPHLRKTAYKVSFTVRQFSNPEEILDQIQEHPENLTLMEFYTAAASLETGSPEFVEVYRAALKQYPDAPNANLNAANAEMEAGNLAQAAVLLQKAGNSPQAEWARAQLQGLQGHYEAALPHAENAAKAGIEGAAQLVEDLKDNIY